MPNTYFEIIASPEAISAWEYRLAKFNAGSGSPPIDLATYLQARF